ncbi:MAG: enolase C-terminal domain-like protein, partial [Nanoarchaeota archaeon]
PLVIGKGSIEYITEATVKVGVSSNGKHGEGTGQGFLSDIWAQKADINLNGKVLSSENPIERHQFLDARMREMVEYSCGYHNNQTFANPLQAYNLTVAGHVRKGIELKLEPLAIAVAISPIDNAIWEAFADMQGISVFECLHRNYSKFLNPPRNEIRVLHTVGGGDIIYNSEVKESYKDGVPQTLEAWIKEEGLSAFKIKLKGNPDADSDRIERIYALANDIPDLRYFRYSLDANESYDITRLKKLMDWLSKKPFFGALLFVEQPLSRYSKEQIPESIKEYGKPIVADESLVRVDDVYSVYNLGYTGIALKPIARGYSVTFQQIPIASNLGMYLTVQDLTSNNEALRIHLDFARRIGSSEDCVEANARQYVSTQDRDSNYAHLYNVKNGVIRYS